MRQHLRKRRILCAAILLSSPVAKAKTEVWLGSGIGSWSNAQNWGPQSVPGSTDDAEIEDYSSNGRFFSVIYDYTGSALTVNSVSISSDSNVNTGATATLSISANTLSATTENIGGFTTHTSSGPNDGAGAIEQTGGTNNVTTLNLGSLSYAVGTYDLSGTGVLNASTENIGASGTGYFNQSGGTNNASGGLAIATIYNQSGGTLVAGGESVNSGTFNQTGGVNNCVNVTLGTFAFLPVPVGELGELAVSAGTTTISGNVTIGSHTTFGGIFGTGGTTVYAPGIVSISGTGQLSASTIAVDHSGALDLSGGTLTVGSISVAEISLDNDAGTVDSFNWTGGALNMPTSTEFNGAASGMGRFFGSSFTAANNRILEVTGTETLGDAGSFNMTISAGGGNVVTGRTFIENQGTLTMNGGSLSSNGLSVINGGRLVVNGGAFAPGDLEFFNGGSATLATTGKTYTLTALGIDNTSKMDLGANDLIVLPNPNALGGPDTRSLRSSLQGGYNNGSWNGAVGMISSPAATNHRAAVGYAVASAINASTFDGQSVNSQSILIKYTLSGDTNLDGKVNLLDFNALATNYGLNSGSEVWTQGDFNYDGTVNSADFALLAANYGQVMATSSDVASEAVPFRAVDFGELSREVPEPGFIGMIAGVGMVMSRRR